MNDYFVYNSDMSPHEIKRQWIEKLCPGQVSELFNYMPDTLYFVKDLELRLMAGNQTFVERCGFQTEEEMIGKSDREIFPIEMAEKYMNDDRKSANNTISCESISSRAYSSPTTRCARLSDRYMPRINYVSARDCS